MAFVSQEISTTLTYTKIKIDNVKENHGKRQESKDAGKIFGEAENPLMIKQRLLFRKTGISDLGRSCSGSREMAQWGALCTRCWFWPWYWTPCYWHYQVWHWYSASASVCGTGGADFRFRAAPHPQTFTLSHAAWLPKGYRKKLLAA